MVNKQILLLSFALEPPTTRVDVKLEMPQTSSMRTNCAVGGGGVGGWVGGTVGAAGVIGTTTGGGGGNAGTNTAGVGIIAVTG